MPFDQLFWGTVPVLPYSNLSTGGPKESVGDDSKKHATQSGESAVFKGIWETVGSNGCLMERAQNARLSFGFPVGTHQKWVRHFEKHSCAS